LEKALNERSVVLSVQAVIIKFVWETVVVLYAPEDCGVDELGIYL